MEFEYESDDSLDPFCTDLPELRKANDIYVVLNVIILVRFSIRCELCSSRRIMQNSFCAAINHVADLSGNKYDISERSTGHAPCS